MSVCGNVNLCAGLLAGIEGDVHAVRQLFDEGVLRGQQPSNQNTAAPDANVGEEILPGAEFLHPAIEALTSADDLEGLLLVDVWNRFNELSQKDMLWTARHRWCNGARFAFNCYQHAGLLILWQQGGNCEILLSCEGVTQGDPLAMILCGVALLPLSESLREAEETVLQPWYADDVAMVAWASRGHCSGYASPREVWPC
jgi:hypothetical protein